MSKMRFKIHNESGDHVASTCALSDAYQLLYYRQHRKLKYYGLVVWNCKRQGMPSSFERLEAALEKVKEKKWGKAP